MSGGTVAGLVAGLVVSAAVLSLVSVTLPPPGAGRAVPVAAPAAPPPPTPAAPAAPAAAPGVSTTAPAYGAVPGADAAPRVVPGTGGGASLPAPVTPPMAPPTADAPGAADTGSAPPAAGATAPTPGAAATDAAPAAPVILAPPGAPTDPGAAPAAPQAEGVPTPEPAPAPAPVAVPEAAPDIDAAAPAAPAGPIILEGGHPQGGGLRPVPGVKVNQLPHVGSVPVTAAPGAPVTQMPGSPGGALVDGNPPPVPGRESQLMRNRVIAEIVQGRPYLSVVLIDDGSADAEALATTGLSVSFAVDPTVPDAQDAAAIYREKGHEVLIADGALPSLATPSDLAQMFSAYFRTVPQAVGVIDRAEGGFQDNRLMAQRVVSILSDGGYGLVTYARGLNAAAQVAKVARLPAAEVYDTLSGNAQDISHALDRAAFRAGQTGATVVTAPATPDVLAALQDWLNGPHGNDVALVPVTAAMGVK